MSAQNFAQTCWAASHTCLPSPRSLSGGELTFATGAQPPSARRLAPVGFLAVEAEK
jgi:hypothetical protein